MVDAKEHRRFHASRLAGVPFGNHTPPEFPTILLVAIRVGSPTEPRKSGVIRTNLE